MDDPTHIPEEFSLCLLFECSSAMQPYIDTVRNKVIGILEEVQQQYPTCKIQIGIATYCDVVETPKLKTLDYTDNFKKATDLLKALRAEGGNPGPKNVNGGFHKSLYKLLMVSEAKLRVHIGAAPCHGKEYHSLEDDEYPKGFKKDVEWKRMIKDMVGMGQDYLFLKVSPDTDLMFAKFREIAESCGLAEIGSLFKQELMCKNGPIAVVEEVEDKLKEEVKKDTGAKKGRKTKKDDEESPERSKEREEGAGKEKRQTRQSTRKTTKEKERSNSRERKKSPNRKEKENNEMKAEKMVLSKEDQDYFRELLKKEIIECIERKREQYRQIARENETV